MIEAAPVRRFELQFLPIVMPITQLLILCTVNSFVESVNFLRIFLMTDSIIVTVKLFAVYQEVIQSPEIQLELPAAATVATVLDRLIEQYPLLQSWRSITQFGVNLEQVAADRPLADGDEVVLIPPVSGG